MNTGCQGPFCHGTGGFCGCNCKCCPPPCCPVISVYFQCCPPASSDPPPSVPFGLWENIQVKATVPAELPDFDQTPIFSADREFTFGYANLPTSCPCETVCVEIKCGGIMPCCCLELIDGKILAVGNGYVTAPTEVDVGSCGPALVYINGLPPPVFVNDCEEINVTLLLSGGTCCDHCTPIDIVCAPCPITSFAASRPLWKRKVDARTGKVKLNPNTGKPIIVLNKTELLRRIKHRMEQSKRRSKK